MTRSSAYQGIDLTVSSHAFRMRDVAVAADVSGALWMPESRTLVFSDLHFEKGSSFARRGLFLPPYDTAATLTAMASVIERYRPQTIISLGDAFHDLDAESRLAEKETDALAAMTQEHHWIWILGNHDPLPPKRFGGAVHETLRHGGLLFGHEPLSSGEWQIVGHMHPCAQVRRNGASIRRRCFMTDGARLILPSFGAYTGGLNVLDAAYEPFFGKKFNVFMMGKDKVYPISRRALCADRN